MEPGEARRPPRPRPTSAAGPQSPAPPIRVYLDLPGRGTIQLRPVPGCDMWEPREDDPDQVERVRVFHAFGPPHHPVPPPGTTIRVEPEAPDVRIVICRYQDFGGCIRFSPAYPLRHTNN